MLKTDLLDLSLKYLKQDIKDFSLEDINILDIILKNHSDLYYNKENPIISDKEYDELFKKLKILEEKNSILLDSTNFVWATLEESSFEKVAHTRPMISLDNTYSSQDLYDFDTRFKKLIDSKDDDIEYTLEYKFDWLWLELVYENWVFIQAITRWDWVFGEDVTQNAIQIANIPKKIDFLWRLEVRWEVVMPISVFKKLNQENLISWEKIFSNPRNRASWSLRLLDVSVTKKRNLDFYAYDLWDYDLFEENNYFNLIKTLEKLGFSISSYFKIFQNIDEIISKISSKDSLKQKIEFLSDNKTPNFDIDWLVIKVNDIKKWKIAWKTQHHPRYAIAYKFPSEIYTTKILSIEHSVWRTWTITPVANLEEVNIWWVNVKRATLHNYDEIKNLWVMIGDRVFIKRAWEVIPDIIWVIKEARNWEEQTIEVPTNCPSCNTKIEKYEDKVRYYCPNSTWCIAQISGKIIYAVGKSWLNIDGLWEKQVELFLKLWFIRDVVSVFNLKNYKEDILTLEWYKDKSINNLLQSIEKSRTVKIDTFLSSLVIPWVWKKTSKVISRLFKSKDDILNFDISKEDLLKIQDIWEETANSIIEYFSNNKDFLQKFLLEIDIIFDNNISKTWIFAWKKICITWSFDWYSRDDLIKILEDNSGEFMLSVSKKTDFLLAWNDAWSKLKKAQDLWVEIIWLEKFFEIIDF